MKIVVLKKREELSEFPKLIEIYTQFNEFINELNNRDFTDSTISFINREIEELNSETTNGNSFKKLIIKKQTRITKLIEKEYKIVPKNYYRNLWIVLGMAAFGIPLGVVFGIIMGNMGLLAIGLPIGMAIGFAVGAEMDKKAFKEGRQLNVELKSGMF